MNNLMIRYFLSIFISLLFFNQTLANDISINENIDLKFVCNLDKKIIKNFIFLTNSSPPPNIIFKIEKEKNIIRTMSTKPPNCFIVSGKSLILFK